MLKIKNNTILILVIIMIVGTFSLAFAAGEQYEKLNLKMAINGTEKGVDGLAGHKFAEMVKEASGGNINISIFPNAQLSGGSMAKSIELLAQGGSFELAISSAVVCSNLDEKFAVIQLPFAFENYDAINEKYETTGGEWLAKMMDSKGLVFFSAMHNGLKQITNSVHEIKTPDDLKGLKIRIPGGEIAMRYLKSAGADPIAMSWSEVFTALQQKTIDGHENSYQTIDSASIYEVQDYLTEWNWSYDGYFFMANKERWNEFSDPVKSLLLEKAREAALWGREFLENGELDLKKKFRDQGMTITELSPEQLKAFKDMAKPINAYFADKYGEEAFSAWGIEK